MGSLTLIASRHHQSHAISYSLWLHLVQPVSWKARWTHDLDPCFWLWPCIQLSPVQISLIAFCLQQRRQSKEMSALQYKINARNALTGRSHVSLANGAEARERPKLQRNSAPANYTLAHLCKLRFASEEYRVLESQMHVRLAVHCHRCELLSQVYCMAADPLYRPSLCIC